MELCQKKISGPTEVGLLRYASWNTGSYLWATLYERCLLILKNPLSMFHSILRQDRRLLLLNQRLQSYNWVDCIILWCLLDLSAFRKHLFKKFKFSFVTKSLMEIFFLLWKTFFVQITISILLDKTKRGKYFLVHFDDFDQNFGFPKILKKIEEPRESDKIVPKTRKNKKRQN